MQLYILLTFCIMLNTPTTNQLKIEICDCNRPTTKGLLDLDLPEYCQTKSLENDKITSQFVDYNVITTKRQSTQWTGHACHQWLHTKTVVSYFFGAYDVSYSKQAQTIDDKACKKMMESKKCDMNNMVIRDKTYAFEAIPTGAGKYLQSVEYTTTNCILHTFQMTQNCENCQIITPFGTLDVDPKTQVAYKNYATIIWQTPKELKFKTGCPTTTPVVSGTGRLTLTSSTDSTTTNQGGRIVDSEQQLEIIFGNQTDVCGMQNHQAFIVTGIPETFVQFHVTKRKLYKEEKFKSNARENALKTGIRGKREATPPCPIKETPTTECIFDTVKTNDNDSPFFGTVGNKELNICLTSIGEKELVVRQCTTHFSPTSVKLQDEFNQQFEYAIDYTLRKTNTNQCVTIHRNTAVKLKECNHDSSRWGIGPNRTGLMEQRTARCITIDANTQKFFLGDCNLNHFTIRQRLRFSHSNRKSDSMENLLTPKLIDLQHRLYHYNNTYLPVYEGTIKRPEPQIPITPTTPSSQTNKIKSKFIPTITSSSTTSTTIGPNTTTTEKTPPPHINIKEKSTPKAAITSEQPQGTDIPFKENVPATLTNKEYKNNGTTPATPPEATPEVPSPTTAIETTTGSYTQYTTISVNSPEKQDETSGTSSTISFPKGELPLETKAELSSFPTPPTEMTQETTPIPSSTNSHDKKEIKMKNESFPQFPQTSHHQLGQENTTQLSSHLNQSHTFLEPELIYDYDDGFPSSTTSTRRQEREITDEQHISTLEKTMPPETVSFVKLFHAQQMEHLAIENENALASEIRQVYCETLKLKKNQAMVLANLNGLLAAKELGLPQCSRIQGNGGALLLQQCKTQEIHLTAKLTECGYIPYYQSPEGVNFTIGKAGLSLHPFSNCFHQNNNNLITIANKIYAWEFTNTSNPLEGEWTEKSANIKLENLNLIANFSEEIVKNYDLGIDDHPGHIAHELETLNIMADIAARMSESETPHLNNAVLSEQEKSNLWDLTSWTERIKYFLLISISLILLTVAIRLAIQCLKPKIKINGNIRNIFKRNYRAAPTAPLDQSHQHNRITFEPTLNLHQWDDGCVIDEDSIRNLTSRV